MLVDSKMINTTIPILMPVNKQVSTTLRFLSKCHILSHVTYSYMLKNHIHQSNPSHYTLRLGLSITPFISLLIPLMTSATQVLLLSIDSIDWINGCIHSHSSANQARNHFPNHVATMVLVLRLSTPFLCRKQLCRLPPAQSHLKLMPQLEQILWIWGAYTSWSCIDSSCR